MIRFISAFLFAVTMLAGAYVVFWNYSTQASAIKLQAALAETFGGSVRYTNLKREYDLTRINLSIKGLEVSTIPNATGQSIIYVLGNVNFVSDFFGKYKMEINLPKNQALHVLQNNKPVKTYSIQMEKGKIVLFPQQNESTMSWLVTIMRDNTKEVLRMGIGDIALKTNSINLLFKNITANLLAETRPINLQTWILKAEFTGLPTMQNMLLPILANPSKTTLKQTVKQIVTFAKSNNANLIITDWITRNGEKSVSATANLELDARTRLWGEAKIITSTQNAFKQVLKKSNLLGSKEEQALNPSLAKLFNRENQPPFSYKVNIRQGDVTVNSLRIGIIPPLVEMLEL